LATYLSQVADARVAQGKADQRAAREVSDAERILYEQAVYAVALQRRQDERKRLRAAASTEEQRQAKREEAEIHQRQERETHGALLQKKEDRQQAAAAKADHEDLLAHRKRIRKEKGQPELPTEKEVARRVLLVQEEKLEQGEPLATREDPGPVRKQARRRREEDESHAATKKQQRVELKQQRTSDMEHADSVAAMRQGQRKELKRQAVAKVQLESQAPAERAAPRERRQPPEEPRLREAGSRQRSPAGLSLAPRAISGGSTAREITIPSAANATIVTAEVNATPYVQTRGSFIIDENGDTVTLRGVAVRGLDTVAPQAGQTLPVALALDPNNLTTITDQWGANLVRIPFAASTILNGNGNLAPNDLLTGLDLTVAAITNAGAYVLLALEGAASAGPADTSTLQVWQTLATRYQGEPRVFYEVFASSNLIAGDLTAEFATVIATIRQQDATALIFIRGSADGLDVTSVPLRDSSNDPIPNLVYTIAVSVQSVPNPEVLSAVSAAYPVFASWSDDGSDLGRQASRVADLFERCGIGWAAANWNNDPRLVTDAAARDFTPTIWGNVMLRALKLTPLPLFEPADAPASLATIRAEVPKLSPLSTSGNFIVDDSGQTIVLRGAAVVGLDSVAPGSGQTLADAISIDHNNLALIRGIWGLNLVRIPFQAQTVLTGNGVLSAGAILAGLDLAATLICEAGAYVLLAIEPSPGASLPDATTQQAWQVLAKRYKDESGVLFEVFGSIEPLATGWFQAALSLIGTIRSQNSAAMIFVNTGNNGDLSGLPLMLPTGDPIYNVVYTVSVSPQNSPGPDDGPLATFADLYPVFASTWTDDATNPSRVSPFIGDFFARHNIGFAAANWNADPRLVADAGNHDFTSTAWGLIAGRAATLPVRQMLRQF